MCLSSRNFADAPCELYVHAVEWTFLLRVSPWVQVYLREAVPGCAVPVLLSLILYKVVDPSKAIRDDALQMLETLSLREWAGEGAEGGGRYRCAVVGSLPDSYQQYQYQLSAKLAQDHPDLSELLCVEMMQRQLDAVDIIAQHQVGTAEETARGASGPGKV